MLDESLSALLDGELTPSELDSVLGQLDPARRARFARMAAAREAVRGSRVPAVPVNFADRVMGALDRAPAAAEPTRSAPRLAWGPLAGVAFAAAVAVVAVLALRPDAAPAPAAVAAAPVAADATLEEAQARRLRAYVMAYSQSRAQQGVGGGTLGYARFAALSAQTDPLR